MELIFNAACSLQIDFTVYNERATFMFAMLAERERWGIIFHSNGNKKLCIIRKKERRDGGKWDNGQWNGALVALGPHRESGGNNMKLDSGEGIASQALQICHHITRESGLKLI